MSDLAIMYSGGLDSYIMHHYAKTKGYNPICISVDLGHPYADLEWQSYLSMNETIRPKVTRLNFKDLYPAIESRITNQIIPSRNVLLAVIGSMFAPRVWLGVLDGEQLGKEHDKSDKYFEDTTNLLSFTNSFFQDKTIIETPFRNMSKAETIKWAIDNGSTKEELFETVSCYSGTHKKCGRCLTCCKRAMAFALNGIIEPGYDSDPFKSEYYNELKIEIPKAKENKDFSRFSEKRIEEFLKIECLLN